jgi:hypothetical protein
VRAGRPNNLKRGHSGQKIESACAAAKKLSARTTRQPKKSTEARALEKKIYRRSGPYLFRHSTHRVHLFLNVQHVLLFPSWAALRLVPLVAWMYLIFTHVTSVFFFPLAHQRSSSRLQYSGYIPSVSVFSLSVSTTIPDLTILEFIFGQ